METLPDEIYFTRGIGVTTSVGSLNCSVEVGKLKGVESEPSFARLQRSSRRDSISACCIDSHGVHAPLSGIRTGAIWMVLVRWRRRQRWHVRTPVRIYRFRWPPFL